MVPDLFQIAPFHMFPVFEADDDKRAHVKLEILYEIQVFRHLHVHHAPFDPSALKFVGNPAWMANSEQSSILMHVAQRMVL